MLELRPTFAHECKPGALFLGADGDHWRPYTVQRSWDDGLEATCAQHDCVHTRLFIPKDQIVGQFVPRHTPALDLPLPALLEHWHASHFPLRAQGHSMGPWSPPGAQLDLIPVRTPQLKIGQVIAWASARRWICHRLREIQHTPQGDLLLITRGDGFPKDDAPIPFSWVLGRVQQVHYRQQSWCPDSPPRLLLASLTQHASWLRSLPHRLHHTKKTPTHHTPHNEES